tara:strand:- start:40789 stop:41142 length:354 start_codon:yes stop_codon:yes gene_type:complete
MNNSEMRGSVAKWVNEFCDMFSVQIPNHDQLCNYLANRIEENLVVENDPDVLMVRKDGKLQPARVINEEKGRGVVTVQLLGDRSYMMMTYAELKKMSSGAEVVAALNAAAGITDRPF